ncbi:MAG: hypothetical protein A2176_09515 [Spirochaetes bacterium RBG_13_51_14]|nr:MAG: hypothetical protein A2176_09515 [Spirochaetes bacterium RBG_13_51_14]
MNFTEKAGEYRRRTELEVQEALMKYTIAVYTISLPFRYTYLSDAFQEKILNKEEDHHDVQ